MPAESAAYLDSLADLVKSGQTPVYAIGGPGDRALSNAEHNGTMPHWITSRVGTYELVGSDAAQTAVSVAETLFPVPSSAALATNASWYDALTGGAMVGIEGGPLLLNPTATADPRVADYLSANSPNLETVHLFGSRLSLADNLIAPCGDAIGLPGHYVYIDRALTNP